MLKSVPSTLLPVCDKGINDSWAIRTYQYRSAFNYNLRSDEVSTENIDAWVKEARTLCNELREYGTTKAEEHIVWLCKHYYADELKECIDKDWSIKNMYDVVKMMNSKKLYSKRHDLYMNLLHMFQYGIFRCAFNAWAVDAAAEWMTKHKLTYDSIWKNN